MAAGDEVLALIFYVAGGVVEGATRLQKTVFLVQRELGLGGFRFKASRYGPWSEELEEAIQELVERGFLSVEERRPRGLQERPAKVYKAGSHLMEQGREAFKELLRRDPALALRLYMKIRAYSALPITYLLAYVYKKYPEYTTGSIIKERVREWQRYYGLRGAR